MTTESIFDAFDRERKAKAPPPPKPERVYSPSDALIAEPGFYPDIHPDQYFAEPCPAPAATHSGLKLLIPKGAAPAKCAYHHPAIGQPPEERKTTIAQYRGKLVHRLALGKGSDYVISPYDDYRSGDAKRWKADVEERGAMPVKQKQFDEAEEMAVRVRAAIAETCEGFEYFTEVVIAWQEEVDLLAGGSVMVWCRAMLDVWCPELDLALDVKTCMAADDDVLDRQFANGYATQDVWYLRGLGKVTGRPGKSRFGFLLVESEEPYLSRPGASTESFRHGAQMDIERALSTFGNCLHANNWPGYLPYQAYPPAWLIHKWTAAEMTELAANGY
jgi:hypothetical protein